MKFLRKRVLGFGIKVLIYLHIWHISITFSIRKLNMIIVFILTNLFTWFFFQKRSNFVSFITPVVQRWLIQIKRLMATPVPFVLSRVADRMTAQIYVLRKSLCDQLKEVWSSIKSWLGRLLHFCTPLRVRVRATVSIKPRFFMMSHQ